MMIKIILLLFVLFVVGKIVWRFFKKEIRGRELVIWLIFWALVALAVGLPQTTDRLAVRLGVSRGADLLVYISVLVLFYLVFRILVKLEKVDKDLTKIVRAIALEEDKKSRNM